MLLFTRVPFVDFTSQFGHGFVIIDSPFKPSYTKKNIIFRKRKEHKVEKKEKYKLEKK